ncbi:hypothetical protein [Actinoplanes sp. NPDC023714]|uniref:hypothetical protein n=1 Tax=Actinoplanes sp. NPDC023714 TaxID=3154322 RepID=UPI0033E9A87D
MPTIGFLHTADVHVETFQQLMAELAPGWAVRHVVDASLLADARVDGVTPEIADRTRARLGELEAAGADLIVCTCSTIGAVAEQASSGGDRGGARKGAGRERSAGEVERGHGPKGAGAEHAMSGTGAEHAMSGTGAAHAMSGTGAAHAKSGAGRGSGSAWVGGCWESEGPVGVPVLRVDRPMAEVAVGMGERIAVVATVESTLEPTIALLRESASRSGKAVTVVSALCRDAWVHFENGEFELYHQVVAEFVRGVAGRVDAVVLAQASMTPAAGLLDGLPVLTSPRTAVQRAVEMVGLG